MTSLQPTTPYSEPELQQFRELLLVRKDRLIGTVRDMEAGALRAGDQDANVVHLADQASDAAEQDLTLSLVEAERHEVYEIDRALLRIREGTYGVCQVSGETIGRARLEAIPHARYTVGIQGKIERGEINLDEGDRA